ncbi:MAG: ketopantoate reductase family protein, partial [Anaerolineales bacterium]
YYHRQGTRVSDQQEGVEPYVALGELDKHLSARVAALTEAFRASGVVVQTPEDISVAMWQKLLFIASWGGVGAVTRMPAGVVRSLSETREMMIQAMREVVLVAKARGIGLTEAGVEQALEYVDHLPKEATASMQRDLMAGRPSELDAQNGAVVRLGAEVGIPAPVHQFLYYALLPGEHRARGLL